MFIAVLFETLSGIALAPVAGAGLLAAGAVAGISHCCGSSDGGGSYCESYSDNYVAVAAATPRRNIDRELRSRISYVGGGVILG